MKYISYAPFSASTSNFLSPYTRAVGARRSVWPSVQFEILKVAEVPGGGIFSKIFFILTHIQARNYLFARGCLFVKMHSLGARAVTRF